MSMWLSKKKKADLVDLCDEVGLRTDGLKKPELEQNLKQFLYQNESNLSAHPSFSSYYESLARSPQKRSSPLPPVFINPLDPILPEGTKRERRQSSRFIPGVKSARGYSTSVDPEVALSFPQKNGIPEERTPSEPDSQPLRRTGSATPVPTRRSARNVQVLPTSPSYQLLTPQFPETPAPQPIPLPPSPSAVADLVEASTHNLRAQVGTYLHEHLTQTVSRNLQTTQQFLSNVVSVATLVHFYELGALLYKLVPLSYPLTIPPIAGNTNPTTIHLPDLFTVLEGRFWGPVASWAVVSVIVPGFVGYFVNLTKNPPGRRARGVYFCDPLTFALAKGLLGWILFYRRTIESRELRTVEEAVGREVLVLVGSLVVGLMGLWEGLQMALGASSPHT